ncbi:hypothetical protein FKP32DRAFT_1672586 [Trametes sanguinea]|nr:hypothetical protein FKP32DRAFT_1672586 [Trametes sanguinea]
MRFQFSILSLAILLGATIAAPLASNDLNVRRSLPNGNQSADWRRAEVDARGLPNGGNSADWKRAEVARSCPNGSAGCGEGPL